MVEPPFNKAFCIGVIAHSQVQGCIAQMPTNETRLTCGLPSQILRIERKGVYRLPSASLWPQTFKLEAIRNKSLKDKINIHKIKFILKAGDPKRISNWQPITLLSVCYKILAKALVMRAKCSLLQIIQPKQTGVLKGRFVLENKIVVQEGMECVIAIGQNTLFLKNDFGKVQ